MSGLLELAERLASLRKTTILSNAFNQDDTITFVLASGHKLRMTKAELKNEINELSPSDKSDEKPKAKPKATTKKEKTK